MTPYYEHAGITIYHGDCREVTPTLEESSVTLVLTDPPYGIDHPTNYATRGRGKKAKTHDYEPVRGDSEQFDPTDLVAIGPCILWGANHYVSLLPRSGSWLMWDKRVLEGVGVNDQSDGELAWSNSTKGVRIFRHMWNGMWRDSERGEAYHPTQKPVALMKWCLAKAKVGGCYDRVYDPYMGAGPVAMAAKAIGCQYVGVELEEKYCEIAAKRLSQEVLPLEQPA